MEIIGALLLICLIGFVVWLATTYIPMDPSIQQLVRVLAIVLIVVIVIILVCNLFGLSLGTHIHWRD